MVKKSFKAKKVMVIFCCITLLVFGFASSAHAAVSPETIFTYGNRA